MQAAPPDDLTAIIGASADAILGLNRAGAITRWNRAAQRMLGHPDGAMAEADLAASLTAADRGRWADVLAHAEAGGCSEGVRFELHRTDGQPIPVVLAVSPMTTPGGGFEGAWVVVRDLTEQLLAQQTLAESELRVRRSEVLAGTGSFVVDRAAAAVQWSQGMYAIFGVLPLDFEPSVEAHVALAHPDERAAVEKAFDAALSGYRAAELDHRTVRPDGTIGWVFLAIEPTYDPAGMVIGASGVCQDVTQRKHAEAAARAALERERRAIEELRRLDSVKEEFLATVSHELRTPLTAILGFSALLRATCDAHEELLEPVERNAQDMHQMVERLLDYSRLESGRVAIELHTLVFADEVDRILRALEPVLVGRTTVLDIDPDLQVCADPEALERILANLIGNAAKYSDPPAEIRVAAEPAEDGVLVTVSDQGPGIPAQHHAQVFERFFRVPGQTAARRGTGVGLSIVRQYVELHGGRISVRSAPGSGTTFTFDLPSVGKRREPR